eukprot:526645_1
MAFEESHPPRRNAISCKLPNLPSKNNKRIAWLKCVADQKISSAFSKANGSCRGATVASRRVPYVRIRPKAPAKYTKLFAAPKVVQLSQIMKSYIQAQYSISKVHLDVYVC